MSQDLQDRTKNFAKRIVFMCRDLPNTMEGRRIGDQVFRSGTSVGANYRAVCRARSPRDFINKLGVVLEEADESGFWLELLSETEIMPPEKLESLTDEANQLVKIFVASINTARRRLKRSKKSE